MAIEESRLLFKVCENTIFLNNAAESPLDTNSKARIDAYLNLALLTPHKRPEVRTPIRNPLAKLFGGSANDYALTTSTGAGIGMAVQAIDWQKGDNVIIFAGEHPNNTYPWQALHKKGVEVRTIQPDSNNRILFEDITKATDKNTKAIAIAAVQYNTGFRVNLAEIGKIAHNNGALFIVDGIQAAGNVPINVETDGIDILSCGGFKWLLGNPGTGFLYVNEWALNSLTPPMLGMFSGDDKNGDLVAHKDARVFETGALAYSLFYGWTAGLKILEDLTINAIHSQTMMLTDLIIKGLKAQNIQILSPIENIEERSGIIVFTLGSKQQNKALYEHLFNNEIIVALRKNELRISPNFFNNAADISSFIAALQKFMA